MDVLQDARVIAMACKRLEFILFRMADGGFRIADGRTAKIELLSPAGAGALAELGKMLTFKTTSLCYFANILVHISPNNKKI